MGESVQPDIEASDHWEAEKQALHHIDTTDEKRVLILTKVAKSMDATIAERDVTIARQEDEIERQVNLLQYRQQQIDKRDATIERLEWANAYKVAGESYRTCIDCKRQPGAGHASKCQIRDAAGVKAGIPAALGKRK